MELITVKEAASALQLSIGSVYGLCRSGELPHYRFGQGRMAIRIGRDDLNAYIDRRRTREGEQRILPIIQCDGARKRQALQHARPFKHIRLTSPLATPPGEGDPSSGTGGCNDR